MASDIANNNTDILSNNYIIRLFYYCQRLFMYYYFPVILIMLISQYLIVIAVAGLGSLQNESVIAETEEDISLNIILYNLSTSINLKQGKLAKAILDMPEF